MEENKERLKTIKNKIIKLIKKNGLTTNGIKNDCEGYLYCISNSIHQVYSTNIYKLGNTINMVDRTKSYNTSYFEKINIHLLLEVPFKFMFETMMFIKLNGYRVKIKREFFTNYKSIETEFLKIKELIENNDPITSIEKYYNYVINSKIFFRITEKITLNKKLEYNLKPKNYLDNYKKKIKNHIPNDKKNGYLLHLDIPEISYGFNNEVQVFSVLSNMTTEFTEFIGDVKIKNMIQIYDVKLAKHLLYDILNNTHIKNKYFMCSNEKAEEVVNKMKYYYDNYTCVEKIIKAYLYDTYQEGEKIEPDKKPTENFGVISKVIEEIKNTFINRIDSLKKKIEYEENIFDCNSSIKYDSDSSDEIKIYNSKYEITKKNELIDEVIIGRNIMIDKKENYKNDYNKKNKHIYTYDKNKKSMPIKVDYTLDDFKYNKRQLKLKELMEED